MIFLRATAAAATLCLAAVSAAAQSTTAAPAPKTDLDSMSGSLSDKLKATGGEIRPQGDVDPAMHKQAPPVGKTPVIPPPDGKGTGSGGLY